MKHGGPQRHRIRLSDSWSRRPSGHDMRAAPRRLRPPPGSPAIAAVRCWAIPSRDHNTEGSTGQPICRVPTRRRGSNPAPRTRSRLLGPRASQWPENTDEVAHPPVRGARRDNRSGAQTCRATAGCRDPLAHGTRSDPTARRAPAHGGAPSEGSRGVPPWLLRSGAVAIAADDRWPLGPRRPPPGGPGGGRVQASTACRSAPRNHARLTCTQAVRRQMASSSGGRLDCLMQRM
jgi:hypothetical protein